MSEETAKKVIEMVNEAQPVVVMVDLCEGCTNRIEEKKCSRYQYPERQFTRKGGCAMDTRKAAKIKAEFKLNPLKASKRGVK